MLTPYTKQGIYIPMTAGSRRWVRRVAFVALSASTVVFLVAMTVPQSALDVDESLTADPKDSSFLFRLAEECSATPPVLQLLLSVSTAFACELVRPHEVPSTLLVVRATAPRAPPGSVANTRLLKET